MDNDLIPVQILQKIMRRWWMIALVMILGGLLGLLFSQFHPRIYESKATVSTVVDYAFLDKLDDWEEDQIFETIGDVIVSTEVKDQVLARAAETGINYSAAEMSANFSADRQDTRWMLRVRDADAEKAQALNSFWAEAALSKLAELRQNSFLSISVQQSLDALTACLANKVLVDPSAALCPELDVAQVKARIDQIASDPDLKMIWHSLALAHTSFDLTEESTVASPVLFGRNISVLAGSLIGLIVGIWLVNSALFDKHLQAEPR